jgi:hypothetical protein
MPANWSLPITTSNYSSVVLQTIDERLDDVVSMFRAGDGSNMHVNSMRFNGDLAGEFERWNGSVWNDIILSVAGGGTGSGTAAGARTNLGLGTIATQNSNAVAITGGSAINLSTLTATDIFAVTFTGGNGAAITNLNANNIASGTVPTARLGSGVANSGSFLRGDQTWAAPAGTLPAGLIAMFDVNCPAGWTRFVALDDRFPRGAAAYGATGGASDHAHGAGTYLGPSHTHGAGSYSAASHNHGGVTGGNQSPSVGVGVDTGNTVADNNDHTHTISSSSPAVTGTSAAGGNSAITGISGTASTIPPYLDMIFCKKD